MKINKDKNKNNCESAVTGDAASKSTIQQKDRERMAVYHYARLRGAGRKKKDARKMAASLIPVSPRQFKEEIWPLYKNQEGVKQAEELVRNPPDDFPEFF